MLEIQTEKPTPAYSSLSLLTMVLGSMRLIAYLLMAIKRIFPVYETAKETLMYRTVLWTLLERERVGRFGRRGLKHV